MWDELRDRFPVLLVRTSMEFLLVFYKNLQQTIRFQCSMLICLEDILITEKFPLTYLLSFPAMDLICLTGL
jgi:hypothetical protein